MLPRIKLLALRLIYGSLLIILIIALLIISDDKGLSRLAINLTSILSNIATIGALFLAYKGYNNWKKEIAFRENTSVIRSIIYEIPITESFIREKSWYSNFLRCKLEQITCGNMLDKKLIERLEKDTDRIQEKFSDIDRELLSPLIDPALKNEIGKFLRQINVYTMNIIGAVQTLENYNIQTTANEDRPGGSKYLEAIKELEKIENTEQLLENINTTRERIIDIQERVYNK